jgi:hypothetical protein
MTKAIEVPEPVLNRAARRKVMAEAARIVRSNGSAYDGVRYYVLRVYYGVAKRRARHAWYYAPLTGVSTHECRVVENKLHDEVGMHLALEVAKTIRLEREKNGATKRVFL